MKFAIYGQSMIDFHDDLVFNCQANFPILGMYNEIIVRCCAYFLISVDEI